MTTRCSGFRSGVLCGEAGGEALVAGGLADDPGDHRAQVGVEVDFADGLEEQEQRIPGVVEFRRLDVLFCDDIKPLCRNFPSNITRNIQIGAINPDTQVFHRKNSNSPVPGMG